MHHPISNREEPKKKKKPKILDRLSNIPINRSDKKCLGRGGRLFSSLNSMIRSPDSKNRGRFFSGKHFRYKADIRSPPKSSGQSTASLTTPAQALIEQDITMAKSLYRGAYVGNESRTIKFQVSGQFVVKVFVQTALRFGCAFRNCQGGSLVMGVNSNGIVTGLKVCHKTEDQARKLVDSAMLRMKPPLFPFDYSLRFLPVLVSGQPKKELKVMCLTFKAPSASAEPVLYSINTGEVYIKREASVQGPLSLSLIIEWYRKKFPYWMNYRLCKVLSRGPPFEDHRSLLEQIMAFQNYHLPSVESDDENSEPPCKSRAIR